MMRTSPDTTTKDLVMENMICNMRRDTVTIGSVFGWMQRSSLGGASDT